MRPAGGAKNSRENAKRAERAARPVRELQSYFRTVIFFRKLFPAAVSSALK